VALATGNKCGYEMKWVTSALQVTKVWFIYGVCTEMFAAAHCLLLLLSVVNAVLP
jgi:hypothetical protein